MLAGLGLWMMAAAAVDPRMAAVCQYHADRRSCIEQQIAARDELRDFAMARHFDLRDPASPARAFLDGPLEMQFLFRCRKMYGNNYAAALRCLKRSLR